MKKSMKEINKQLNKEALLTLGLFLLFFLWWYATAYGLADAEWTVFGLPAWFFMSCVVGWLLCCLGVTFLVKKFFRDVDLDSFAEELPEGELPKDKEVR